ncbi:Rft-1-domain-containing protein [Pholiota conissans]|uniref:Man(5)GlcNAc(2)-PP-dolichol translocation protein RFT1 n=1 Tax=Pholiota conissans TaxID=109636 RepID=A0A9P5Z990_9AGAR|nr:Rft-1-domain-containing protein [Pholiota conissans]
MSSEVASASSLIGLQLLSRLTTFALNQALFRLASPTAFGAASIQLDLVLSTILFLSREGVRGALLRAPSQTQPSQLSDLARISNLAFLPVIAGIPLALSTAALFAYTAGAELQAQPHFHATVALYAFAAACELFSEPLYNFAMTHLKINIRVRAEGFGVTAKSVTTFLLLLYDSRNGRDGMALIAFALGQLMYSVAIFATYILSLGAGPMRPIGSSVPSSPSFAAARSAFLSTYFDSTALQLSLTLTLQSLVKHFLTEGDKLILSWFSPLSDQGGYAIAVNYGSLIARIIFQPIEESLRIFFSRTLGTSSAKSQPSLAALAAANATLTTVLRTQASLSILLVVFGSSYLPVLLPLLLPSAYMATSAPRVLSAWIWFIPVLAVNGAVEAFLASVAAPADLNRQSQWMIAFSAIYITTALAFYRVGFGDASLVYANILNLSARVIYCMHFATRYFTASVASKPPTSTLTSSKFNPLTFVPPTPLLLFSLVSAILVKVSELYWLNGSVVMLHQLGRKALMHPAVLAHVGVGALLCLVCLGVWWRVEGRDIVQGLRTKAKE